MSRDQISQIGAVSEDRRGPGVCAEPMIVTRLMPQQTTRPSTQFKGALKRMIWRRPNEQPSNAGNDPQEAGRLYDAPSATGVGYRPPGLPWERITGSPYPGIDGQNIEPASWRGDASMPGDVSESDHSDPTPLINKKDAPPDVLSSIQDIHGYAGESLRSFRGNFAFVPVAQFPPSTRSFACPADKSRTLVLPDNTVAVRFAWTNGADLWVSPNGMANVPTMASLLDPAQGVNSEPAGYSENANIGLLLNPIQTMYYFVKGWKSIGVASHTDTIVNLTCYQQN